MGELGFGRLTRNTSCRRPKRPSGSGHRDALHLETRPEHRPILCYDRDRSRSKGSQSGEFLGSLICTGIANQVRTRILDSTGIGVNVG